MPKCNVCGSRDTIVVALTIPKPPYSTNPNAPQDIVGYVRDKCLRCYSRIYGEPQPLPKEAAKTASDDASDDKPNAKAS